VVPVFYLGRDDRYVICNVRPPHEGVNPWVLNVLADPRVRLTIGRETLDGRSRPADESEVDRYWPALVRLWPAFQSFRDAGGSLSVFVLDVVTPAAPSD
jgi:deazaflavin-dependent oxidoreductase (nitroreductase family)